MSAGSNFAASTLHYYVRYAQAQLRVCWTAGLTKMVAKLSRENAYRKGLEVYDALPAIGLMADTAITNAAISACDKGADKNSHFSK